MHLNNRKVRSVFKTFSFSNPLKTITLLPIFWPVKKQSKNLPFVYIYTEYSSHPRSGKFDVVTLITRLFTHSVLTSHHWFLVRFVVLVFGHFPELSRPVRGRITELAGVVKITISRSTKIRKKFCHTVLCLRFIARPKLRWDFAKALRRVNVGERTPFHRTKSAQYYQQFSPPVIAQASLIKTFHTVPR